MDRLKLFYFILSLVFSLSVFANPTYDIKVFVPGQADSIFYLARYQSGRILMADTASNGMSDMAVFSGDTPLNKGIYILASSGKTKLVEFIVDDEQAFTIALPNHSSADEQVRVEGSLQNALFFEHIMLNSKLIETINNINAAGASGEDALSGLIRKRDSLEFQIKTLKQSIVGNHPDFLLSKMLLAMEDVMIPDSLQNDEAKAYKYYKEHYWANTDLKDERLLGTPLLPQKLETYFERLVPPVPEAVIRGIDNIISLSGENTEVRDYLIWHFTTAYQNPKIMGMDKVFVHLADHYFAHLNVGNTSEQVRQRILERADQLRPLLIGQQAPNLMLIDTAGNFVSFNQIANRFTVLFFWDHDCGICKKDMAQLKTFYDNRNYDFEVFAISTNSNKEEWKAYLDKHKLGWISVNGTVSMTPSFHDLYDIYSTPVIYVLDSDKKIIAKRINVEQLDLVFKNHP